MKIQNHCLVVLVMGALVTCGCAADRVCKVSCPDACAEACAADCLPKTFGAAEPNVTLADWNRCVEPVSEDAIPSPPGTYVNAWLDAQQATASQRHRVITRNEWFAGGDQLSPDGVQHLHRLASVMSHDPSWVVIESQPLSLKTDESYSEALQRINELQQRRRQLVVAQLSSGGVADADRWVIFAEDRTVGVRGIEAPQIFNRQFQTGGQGNRGGAGNNGFGGGLGGGGLGGGFGGGGFGGGGFGGGGGLGGGGIF